MVFFTYVHKGIAMKKIIFGAIIILNSSFGATIEEAFSECISGDTSYCKSIINQLPKLESCIKICETESYNCMSCNQIGLIYILLDNLSMAKEYFKKSISIGNYYPYLHLWNMNYYYGDGESISILEQNCKAQNTQNGQKLACFILGKAYLKGRGIFGKGKGIAQDYKKAFSVFEKSCDLDFSDSCNVVAYLYMRGKGTRQNLTKAKELFGKSCDLGNQGGCNAYNNMR